MGQAKQRGSFEERQQQAITRIAKEAIEREDKYRAWLASLTPEHRAKMKEYKQKA